MKQACNYFISGRGLPHPCWNRSRGWNIPAAPRPWPFPQSWDVWSRPLPARELHQQASLRLRTLQCRAQELHWWDTTKLSLHHPPYRGEFILYCCVDWTMLITVVVCRSEVRHDGAEGDGEPGAATLPHPEWHAPPRPPAQCGDSAATQRRKYDQASSKEERRTKWMKI